MALIVVRVAPINGDRVALWERSAAHPHGEILLSRPDGAPDAEHLVGETADVLAAIADGRLIRVRDFAPEAAPAPEPVEPPPAPAGSLAGAPPTEPPPAPAGSPAGAPATETPPASTGKGKS